MLIVRGVNVFPTAVREVVAELRAGGQRRHRDPPAQRAASSRRRRCRWWSSWPRAGGDAPSSPSAIARRIRERLVVAAEVELVPWGTLPRSDYKSKLVDWSRRDD